MSEEFSFSKNLEHLAEAFPDRTLISFRDRRFTYAEFRDRSRRLANYLMNRGLGSVTPRETLSDWQSGQDHVALFMYNGNEYLEGMMGAYMSRTVPFNVNYRYVESELAYLLDDARPRAVLYHARFAPVLAELLAERPWIEVLLQVDDGSGEQLLDRSVDYEAALASSPATRPDVEASPDDLYMIYTGGTTGMPKGVIWRQHDIFMSAMGGTYGKGEQHESLEHMVEGARRMGDKARVLPLPPFMHASGHWTAFMSMHSGGTVYIQDTPEKLMPREIWPLVEREDVTLLTVVGDAFAIPLVEELDRQPYDLSSLKMLGSGGAVLSQHIKDRFRKHLPHLKILDTVGSSESGNQAMVTDGKAAEFKFAPGSHVANMGLSRLLKRGELETGYLARSGNIPLGYLNDPKKTQETFVRIDGVRYSIPGDHAQLVGSDGMKLLGRGSGCINSGGEKIYPEEVEEALKTHPNVSDVVVFGLQDARWGSVVTAVVQPREGCEVDLPTLQEHSEASLARYKVPRKLVIVEQMVRSPSGKADYRWAKEVAGGDA